MENYELLKEMKYKIERKQSYSHLGLIHEVQMYFSGTSSSLEIPEQMPCCQAKQSSHWTMNPFSSFVPQLQLTISSRMTSDAERCVSFLDLERGFFMPGSVLTTGGRSTSTMVHSL